MDLLPLAFVSYLSPQISINFLPSGIELACPGKPVSDWCHSSYQSVPSERNPAGEDLLIKKKEFFFLLLCAQCPSQSLPPRCSSSTRITRPIRVALDEQPTRFARNSL